MPKYTVITPLEHDQTRHEPGSTLELSEEQAGPLAAAGAVEPCPERPAKKGRAE